MRRFEIA